MLEKELQKLALEYLKRAVPSGFFFRVERKGRQLYGAHSATTPGTPAILGCIQGLFVGIELKVGYGTLNPAQKVFREGLEAKGGLYFVVKSIEELEMAVSAALIAEWGRTQQQGVAP